MSDMLRHALDYAARGVRVFPCAADKRPVTAHGLHDATTDTAVIRRWWTSRPDALIGAAMGQESGLFAIDPDAPKRAEAPDGVGAWQRLKAANGGHAATHTHVTPSGGKHVLFRWNPARPVTNSKGSLPAGIDVRGQGGYVVMAPSRLPDGRAYELASIHDHGHFAEAPAWLLDLIEKKPQRDEPPRGSRENVTGGVGSHERYVAAAVERECENVAQAASGGRNEALNRAAFALGTIVGAGHLDAHLAADRLLDAARAARLVRDDGQRAVMATIESGLTAGAQHPREMPAPRAKAEKAEEPRAQRKASTELGADQASMADGIGNDLLTEDEAALRFAVLYTGRLRYCHDHGAWFEWTGSIWRKNATGLAFHWARELARQLAAEEADKTRMTASKAAFAGAVERFARSDPALAVTSETWDRDPFLLGTPSGTVDLRTGLLRVANAADGITQATAVAPADIAECPLWLRFMDETTGGDAEMVRFIQQWAGYSLTGDTREHALCFVFGGGGNGKSVYLNVISGIMGAYATTAAMETFIATGGDKHPTDLAMLRGARLVTASETEEGRQWAESRIKALTGGDRISARFMRQDYFQFVPAFKLTIIGNHKPVLRNIDDAARRRFNLVPFTRKPANPDRQLEEKLRAEWPGILRWMIEGCLDWQANGLVRPSSVIEATKDYFEAQDTFGAWLEEDCLCEPGNTWKSENSSNLFEAWSRYAKNAGELPGTRKAFADQLQHRGFEKHKGAGGSRNYRGISLRPSARTNAFTEAA